MIQHFFRVSKMGTLLSKKKTVFYLPILPVQTKLSSAVFPLVEGLAGDNNRFSSCQPRGSGRGSRVPSYWFRDWLGTIIGFLPAHAEGVPGAAGVPEAVHPLVV